MTTAFANVLAFAAAAAVLVATPGLDTAVVLRQATVEGPKSAALAACGVATGFLVWSISAARSRSVFAQITRFGELLPISETGQSLHFLDVGATSVFHLIATKSQTRRQVA